VGKSKIRKEYDMPDSSPQNIDVTKLHELLDNTEEQQQIGHRVIRAVIIDVLRSKAGGTEVPWIVRHLHAQSCVLAVLQELVDEVSLTEDELRILNELEKEQEKGDSLRGG
jgi:hypothetical protein